MLNRDCWLIDLNAHKAEVAGDCRSNARCSILRDAILVATLIPHANGNGYLAAIYGAINRSKGTIAGSSLAISINTASIVCKARVSSAFNLGFVTNARYPIVTSRCCSLIRIIAVVSCRTRNLKERPSPIAEFNRETTSVPI